MTVMLGKRQDSGISEGIIGMTSSVLLELKLYAAGYCRHPEWLTLRGGSMSPVPFPAGFAFIRHPLHGNILFDTGYSARFFEETKRLPALLYRWITPVTFREEESAANQLRLQGVQTDEIDYVILSHFHGDHISGLCDFPRATILYKREAYEAVRHLGAFASVKAGYLPGLLPEDFELRSAFVEDKLVKRLPEDFPFSSGYDLFGDGSLLAIDMPGHAAGQIGLWLSTLQGEQFLCADAVWSSRAFRECRKPHAMAGIIMNNRSQYNDTFERLCQLHSRYPKLRIVPSHCREALMRQAEEEGES